MRPRPHFYEFIGHWHDQSLLDFYGQMVARFPSGSRFVEVGAWLGRSTAFLGVEIINSGKTISVDVIDTWQGSTDHDEMLSFAQYFDVFSSFWQNMVNGRVSGLLRPIMLPSVRAARAYDDGELDFVFIDAGHQYEDVKQDILAWRPKVKAGGVLAGHDYDSVSDPGVVKAVDELMPGRAVFGRCWMVPI